MAERKTSFNFVYVKKLLLYKLIQIFFLFDPFSQDHHQRSKRKREATSSGDRNQILEHFNQVEAVNCQNLENQDLLRVERRPWHPAGHFQYTNGIIG